MLYLGYQWDLNSDSIKPDKEIDTKKLDWKAGEYWKTVEFNGRLIFVKVDKLEEFILKGVNSE